MALNVCRFSIVDTGSMRPALAPGDIAFLTPEDPADVRKGQILAFHPPGEPRLTVIHRVLSVSRTGDGVAIRTKGDANNAADAWRIAIIKQGARVWHEHLEIPKLGYLVAWGQRSLVRMIMLILTTILAVNVGLRRIWRPISR
jgi:signal peptidase I